MNILCITGRRSEAIKMAPILRAFKKKAIPYTFIDVSRDRGWFMKGASQLSLGLPRPHRSLGLETESLERIINDLVKIILEIRPTHVLGVGGTDTALAAATSAVETQTPFIHLESGLRIYDLFSSPYPEEEVMRQRIDRLSSLYFAPSRRALGNLLMEEVDASSALEVGSTTIDSLTRFLPEARKRSAILEELELEREEYVLLTLHRRENLSPYRLTVLHRLIGMMDKLVVFPVHPETRKAIYESGLREKFYETENLLMTEPMEYLDFLLLEEGSHLVMTDSGGVCEEATYMEKPLIILRERTERPEPVEAGVAKMLRLDDIEFKGLEQYLEEGLKRRDDRVKFAYGVGDAAERVAEHIASTPLKAKPKIRDMREILLYQEFSLGREQPFPQVREEVERRGCQVIAALDGMGGTILEGSGKASKILVKGYKHLLETISNMGL